MDEFEIDSQLLHKLDRILDEQDEDEIEQVVGMIMNLITTHDHNATSDVLDILTYNS